MGSFNISCAVSHLTISPGDKCVFIPLRPIKYRADRDRQGGFIVTNNGACAVYRPATMPIYGTYDDYGNLRDIEENVTTEALKEYNWPHVEMMEVINSGADLYSSDISYWMDEKIAKLVSSYKDVNLEKDLTSIGFNKSNDNDTYMYPGHDAKVKIINNQRKENSFPTFQIILNYPEPMAESRIYTFSDILKEYHKKTGYLIGFGANEKKVKRLRKLSGYFVRRDIYEFMAAKYLGRDYGGDDTFGEFHHITEAALTKLGFIKSKNEERNYISGSDKERYNQIYCYPNVTKYQIRADVSGFCHIFDVKKDKFLNVSVYTPNYIVKEFSKLAEIQFPDDVKTLLAKKTIEVNYDYSRLYVKDQYNMMISRYFSDELGIHCLFDHFDKVKATTFYNVYKKHFKHPQFPIELVKLNNFVNNLFATNRMLYPSVIGHQCGEIEADVELSKFIANAADEKYKEHLAFMKEYEDE